MNDEIFFTHDPIEMVAGTRNTISTAYRESVSLFNEASQTAISPMEKNFISNIGNEISTIHNHIKGDNVDIRASKGNIEAYKHSENIEECIKYLKQLSINVPDLKYIESILQSVKSLKPLYVQGFQDNVPLIILEYESAVYMIIDGISNILSNNIEVSTNSSGTITIKSKHSVFKPKNVISTTLRDLSNELNSKSHKDYLESLIEIEKTKLIAPKIESVEEYDDYLIESAGAIIGSVLKVINTGINIIKNSFKAAPKIFKALKQAIKVLPVIRSIVYIHYYKKAKKISAIEQQVAFIQLNIERLKNKSNMKPEEKEAIIKKQERMIQAYEKRAEKLRADFVEAEKDAANEIQKNNKTLKDEKKTSSDDDFVLESSFTEVM